MIKINMKIKNVYDQIYFHGVKSLTLFYLKLTFKDSLCIPRYCQPALTLPPSFSFSYFPRGISSTQLYTHVKHLHIYTTSHDYDSFGLTFKRVESALIE